MHVAQLIICLWPGKDIDDLLTNFVLLDLDSLIWDIDVRAAAMVFLCYKTVPRHPALL